MKKLILILISFLSGTTTMAQEITGSWKGSITIQGTQLGVVFHIEKEGDTYKTKMDSPDQGAFGIAAGDTQYEGGTLTINAPKLSMTYSGILVGSDKLEGTFEQGGMSMPLHMDRFEVEKTSESTENIEINESLLGSWSGELNLKGKKLQIVFHIEGDETGYSSKMDSPDQGAFGLGTASTTYANDKLTIEAPAMGITFVGNPKSANSIEGTFKQGGMSLPLMLKKLEEGEEIEKPGPRPQDPKDFPYEQEEVSYKVPEGGHTMAGTLTYPSDKKFEQVVVLISGSGAQNRNEELGPMNHRPFLVLSDHLTRQGIAVLRYDDRGVAESTGDFKSATSKDFADDAAAAVAYLKTRTDMKGKKIGLMGHSEGGMIAPIVASKNKEIDFITLLAGPGTEIPELLTQQAYLIGKANGMPEKSLKQNQEGSMKIYKFMNKYPELSKEALKEKLEGLLEEIYNGLDKKDQEEIGSKEAFFESQTSVILSPWFRYFMSFNPADYLTKVSCPVLAVNGELDL
ncbi:MAG: alpha/beta fold hydrolase, partial [Bacteroidota bacterium]